MEILVGMLSVLSVALGFEIKPLEAVIAEDLTAEAIRIAHWRLIPVVGVGDEDIVVPEVIPNGAVDLFSLYAWIIGCHTDNEIRFIDFGCHQIPTH